MKERMRQHKNDVKNRSVNKSALVQHAIDNNHHFDFDAVNIVARSNNYHKRMLTEEIFIKSDPTCVNSKSKESKNVNTIYCRVLDKWNLLQRNRK